MDDCQGRIERYKAIPSKKKKESWISCQG
jgi:hypothetical protein